MKVSREQMVANRAAILEVAGRLFRERGFDAVSVSDVMAAAGFTHGGFYGHFSSKDDLIAHAVAHALAPGNAKVSDFHSWIDAYLSPVHRDDLAGGCPTAGLAGPMRHQSSQARAAMTAGLERQIDRLTEVMAETDVAERRRAAIGSWAAMVGAVILARTVDDQALSDELLEQTRQWLEQTSHSHG